MYHDLTGKKFNRLIVLYKVENKIYTSGRKAVQWMCKCDCGKEIKITANALRSGGTKSCGCFAKEISKVPKFKIHGMTNTRLFQIWGSMKQRCYNKNHIGYYRYGERGIKICEEWLDKKQGFLNFYNWAIQNKYNDNLSIDRINIDGNYEPNNCRWATSKEQQLNRRVNRKIKHNGEIKTLMEWCEILNFPYQRAAQRFIKGLSFEEIFSPPRIWKSIKQSNIKGVIYNKRQDEWHVKGYKNNKPDIYIRSFKNLNDAIEFKKEYDKNSFS